MNGQSVALAGASVRLVPLALDDAPRLWEIAEHHCTDIFRWYTHPVASAGDMEQWVEKAIREREQGVSVPFVTVEIATGQIAGSTRFMDIDRENRSVMIGNTWLAPNFQRTSLNTEAKYLMMRHAFEVWRCVRVALRTDSLNEKSRAAILRIGAKEEGTLRNHLVCHDGRLRHSIYFSVIASEWREVKLRLEGRMHRGA